MIAIVVVLLVVAAIVAVVLKRRSSPAPAPSASAPTPPAKVRPPDKPMDGLESALAAVTDRDGRPMRERIDAEAGHVDEFRVPDDTGPLLRRALDHVAPAPSDETARTDDEVADDGATDSTDTAPHRPD